MNDGIIKNDGTSRFLAGTFPATYEEFRQLAEQKKLPVDILFNAAGWLAQPDFLNKANLLKDKTAAMYGLPPSAVPDDVLAAVFQKIGFLVGDIRATVKNDLGDDWLLCNGDVVERAQYPALSNYFPRLFSGTTGYKDALAITRSDGTYISKIIRLDDQYVAVGVDQRSLSDSTVFLAYVDANDITAPWTVVTLWSYDNVILSPPDIAVGNGYIVVAGRGPRNVAYIAYSTTVTGGFQTKEVWFNLNSSNTVRRIKFLNGMFVIAGAEGISSSFSKGVIAYATDPSGTWTKKDIFASVSNRALVVSDILYQNGQFVLLGFGFLDTAGEGVIIGTAANLADDFTFTRTEGISAPRIDQLKYLNGKYVYTRFMDSVNNKIFVYTANNPAGPWAPFIVPTTESDYRILDIDFVNGYWVVVYQYATGSSYSVGLCYATELTTNADSWVFNNDLFNSAIGMGSDQNYNRIFSFSFDDLGQKYLFAGSKNGTNTRAVYTDTSTFALPEIPPVDVENHYIKAK